MAFNEHISAPVANTTIAAVHKAAREANEAGLCIIPPAEDGTKRPLPNARGTWDAFKTVRPTGKDLEEWYPGRSGIGVVTGPVSGRRECWDFDDRATYEAFVTAARQCALGVVIDRIEAGYCDDTPGDGVRWLVRYPAEVERAPGSRTILARRPKLATERQHDKDNVKVLIELPAFSIVAPTNGRVHPSGRPYLRRSGSFSSIAAYTSEEREALIELARSFDGMPRRELYHPVDKAAQDARPGDEFNRCTTWDELLGPQGWTKVFTRNETSYWRRPGKGFGISATTNYAGADLLYVFTSSTAFDDAKSYSRFGAYAVLEHDGDFRAAARALLRNRARARDSSSSPDPALPGTAEGEAGGATDCDLADLMAERHSGDLRYVAAWSKWCRYDGKVWKTEATNLARNLAKALCHQAALGRTDGEVRRIASAKTVAGVQTLASSDRRIAATVDQWDADPWLLNTPAGVVDLRTGNMRAHRPDDHMSKIAAAAPGGSCPQWLSFLNRTFGGDEQLVAYMRRVAGYGLTGLTQEQAMFFGHGTGGNGKSVLLDTFAGIVGDYHTTAPIETFTMAAGDRHPTELAMLRGARLVTAIETEEGRRWAESRIKALTGGDRIAARFMRQDFFEFKPQFKLIIAGNHKPSLRTVDEAIRRRFNLIPFAVTIPAAERDPALSKKLQSEWGGILQWMIEGCLEWQQHGLCPPKAVTDATTDYLTDEDAIAAWLAECCEVNANASDSPARIYKSWKAYADRSGELAGSLKAFGPKLEARGFAPPKRSNGKRTYQGLRVKPPEPDEPHWSDR